jgi:glycosyltransferase involved in cell wall biosynthesis
MMALCLSAYNDTIVLHDYFRFTEGGGRLCLILTQQLKADLAYGFKVKNHPYFDEYRIKGRQYCLKAFMYIQGLRNISLMNAFSTNTEFLRKYDAAVYSGFYAPLAVVNHLKGRNIFYCHTPPRYIYDQREYYLSLYPGWYHPLIRCLVAYHQPRYEAAIEKMDCIVTNSFNVKQRIKKFLGIEALVVYPPCEVDKFLWIGQDDFYLSAARLDPLKRVDLVVDAFIRMPDRNLIVISGGHQLEFIRRKASDYKNIKVMGNVSEKDYRRLMGSCIATIYIPKDEDFGMAPIESMAAGKPVISVKEGGLVESIVNNETGLLIPADPKVENVIDAVRRVDKRKARQMMAACKNRAEKFHVDVFISKMKTLLL